jgi:hypothetical protein
VFSFLKAVWQKNWKGKATLIFGAVIFLTAAITIPYAVITRQGDEGFLKAPNGKELKWPADAFPLTCTFADSVKESHLVLYNKVRAEVNSKVGKELLGPCVPWLLRKDLPQYLSGGLVLRVEKVPEDRARALAGGTVVEVETPWTSHPGGRAPPLSRRSEPHVIVAVPVWIDPAHAANYSVWLHEVGGHALGLKHDRLRDSIMWPTIQERPGKLSSTDVRGLKEAYK